MQSPDRLVVVSNVFGDINRGGAAITAQTVRVALEVAPHVAAIGIGGQVDPAITHRHTLQRFPDVQILGSPIAVAAGPLEGLRTFVKSIRLLVRPAPRRPPEPLRRLRESSLVVSKGGHVYVDRPSARSLLSLWATAYPVIYAQRVGIPTMTSPTSVGPFRSMASRRLNRFILSRMTFVVARDPISWRNALDLGLHETQVVHMPDIVFAMAPPTPSAVRSICQQLGLEPGRFVTMTVRLASKGGNRAALKSALVNSARAVLEHQDVDRVVIVDQAGDGADSDEVAKELGVAASVLSSDLSPEELVALYGGAHLTIACRLHSAIFSLVGGTKSVVVSLDGKKSEGVFEALGLPGEWVVTRLPTDLERLPRLAKDLLQQDEWTRDVLHRQVTKAASALEGLPALMEAAIAKRPRPGESPQATQPR